MLNKKSPVGQPAKDVARVIMVIGTALTVVMFVLYFYYVRTGKVAPLIQSYRQLGVYGIIVAIFLLAILCVLPVPSEFLIVMNLEVYGVWFGTLYNLLGGVIGAVAALYLTRWLARDLVERHAGKHLERVNHWLYNRGSFGLLVIRFIPLVPYHLVNYIAGLLRVRLWPFVWTTAIGILPFDLAVAGMFSGVRRGAFVWGFVGLGIFLVLSLLGVVYRKRIF